MMPATIAMTVSKAISATCHQRSFLPCGAGADAGTVPGAGAGNAFGGANEDFACLIGCGIEAADALESAGAGHWESLMLTPRFYHTPRGSLPRSHAPASSHACDEERAPSQATPPLR